MKFFFHCLDCIEVVKGAQTGSVGLIYKVFFSNDNRERSLVAKLARLQKL